MVPLNHFKWLVELKYIIERFLLPSYNIIKIVYNKYSFFFLNN